MVKATEFIFDRHLLMDKTDMTPNFFAKGSVARVKRVKSKQNCYNAEKVLSIQLCSAHLQNNERYCEIYRKNY